MGSPWVLTNELPAHGLGKADSQELLTPDLLLILRESMLLPDLLVELPESLLAEVLRRLPSGPSLLSQLGS